MFIELLLTFILEYPFILLIILLSLLLIILISPFFKFDKLFDLIYL